MKIIKDEKIIHRHIQQVDFLKKYEYRKQDLSLFFYEKREVITSALHPLEHIMFVTEGYYQIYDITLEGNKTPMGISSPHALIGDIEFCSNTYEPFFAEAATDLYCIALPVRSWRETLNQDVEFLQFLNRSLAQKLENISYMDIRKKTVEERLLYFMEYIFPDHTLLNVEQAAVMIRCSRRQLQRVLHSQCETGTIEKAGKGKYRLVEEKYQSVMDDRHSV